MSRRDAIEYTGIPTCYNIRTEHILPDMYFRYERRLDYQRLFCRDLGARWLTRGGRRIWANILGEEPLFCGLDFSFEDTGLGMCSVTRPQGALVVESSAGTTVWVRGQLPSPLGGLSRRTTTNPVRAVELATARLVLGDEGVLRGHTEGVNRLPQDQRQTCTSVFLVKSSLKPSKSNAVHHAQGARARPGLFRHG